MDHQEFPHSIKTNSFNYTTDIKDKFEVLHLNLKNNCIVEKHYTFTEEEILAILKHKASDGSFKPNALTIKPVVDNGVLRIFLVATEWDGKESEYPKYPGGGYPDGPPILVTKVPS